MTLDRRTLLLILSCFAPLRGAQKPDAKKTRTKEPEVVLVDSAAKVEDEKVLIDGHVRNSGQRPIRKLTIFYVILDSDKRVLTRQKGSVDEEVLDPGGEAAFSAQIQHHARAVFYRFEFEDGNERELRAEKAGPFPLE